MLFASEALVVVAFAFEQLLKVGFTVKFTLKSCKGSKTAGREGIQQLYKNQKVTGEEEINVNKQENTTGKIRSRTIRGNDYVLVQK